MRRKTKQLLATGMALAVLATNLMPVSLAAETAEELQTGEVATQALTDEIAARSFYHKNHIYTEPIRNGFELVNSETGEARPYVVVGCTNLIGSCDQKEATYYGKIVSPSGTTNATCTSDKVFSYSATWILNNGIWSVDAGDITVPNSKVDHKFTNYVNNTEATCTKNATEIASCDYGCGKTSIRDIKGTKLGHDFTKKDAAHVTFDFAENGKTAVATIRCDRCNATTTEKVPCTAEVTTPATCTEWGVTTYTATYGDASASVDKTDIKPLGHDFTDYDFHWVDEETCMEAIAQLSCSRCEGVTETIPAEVTVDRVANCTTTGKETHKASLYIDGELYETLSKEFYPAALGHLYTGATLAWDDNTYMTATASLDCQREDCSHVEKETVNALIIPKVAPTCTETGVDIHRVTYSLEGEEVARLEEEVTVKALGHKFLNYVSDGNATCTKDGTKTAVCERQNCNATDTVNDEGSALGHDYGNKDNSNVTFTFSEDGKAAVATVTCVRAGCTASEDGHTCTADAKVTAEVTKPATCTEMGETTYTATYENASATKTVVDVPALGHSFTNYVYNGDATCGGDGTETAKCDRCDVTDTRTAVATAGCDLHTVDGAKVCAVCGKVDGQPKLAAAEASADVDASTIGVHLVVRVGTLPTGQKVITVAFLNNDGQAVQMFGTQKIHVSLAQLKAALGDTEGTGFEHTLTRVNTANGEKQNVGFTVENGTVNFDAAFNGSTACILLVD